jgi:putative two-component system response regulator
MGVDIAMSHHEKWDGSGYPQGLRGEQIPLSARMVAIADVYDALTHARCYKPAFSHEDSAKIIREGAGRHFDPAITDVFL